MISHEKSVTIEKGKGYEKKGIAEAIINFGTFFFRDYTGNVILCVYLDGAISSTIYL